MAEKQQEVETTSKFIDVPIWTNCGKTEIIKGEFVELKSAPKHKFAVCFYEQLYRVTELTTGLAIPGSFAESAEESIRQADATIEKVNNKGNYFDGMVVGIRGVRWQLVIPAQI